MKLPITGPTYQHSSQDVNYQKCINLFLSDAGPLGRGETGVLVHTPGLKSIGSVSGKSEVRALFNHNNEKLYCVMDNTVYLITFNEDALTATFGSIGTIATSTGAIGWAINPTQIMLVDGSSSGYIITVATDTLALITDVDFTGGTTVCFIDSYFVYNTPGAATMFATKLNDGTDINALDVATAEGRPDDLVAVLTDKREVWAFGTLSTEFWYNAANASGFPLSRRDGAFMDIGCGAAFSAIQINNGVCWLDNRGFIVFASGYAPQVISSPAMAREMNSYTTLSDATAFSHMDRGHLFYVISFPTENKTWAFDFVTEQWHERAYFNHDDSFERHKANCHVRWKNWEFVGGKDDGNVYILHHSYYDDAGDPIHRLRTTAPFNDEFRRTTIHTLELQLETGKALSTGTGSNPQLMMRYSNDGGYSWSNEAVASLGAIGEYAKLVRWTNLGGAREWMFEFRFTDPIPFTILDASINIIGETDGYKTTKVNKAAT